MRLVSEVFRFTRTLLLPVLTRMTVFVLFIGMLVIVTTTEGTVEPAPHMMLIPV